jgi:hypothetical protein
MLDAVLSITFWSLPLMMLSLANTTVRPASVDTFDEAGYRSMLEFRL